MRRESLNVLFPVGFGKQAGTRAFCFAEDCQSAWTREEVSQRRQPNEEIKTLTKTQISKGNLLMRTLNNKINLDRANGAEEHASQEEATMRNASTKTPWHLRFAPGVILRLIGRFVSKAGSLASAIIQPVRQRLNQWNWRKKTALVTALAITAGGVFYQQRAHAAAFLGPILATKTGDFFVKFFVGYVLNKGLEAAFAKKLRKTADATPDGEPLYSNREYNERDYNVDESGTETENYRVDAKADALFHKAYNTTGTDPDRIHPPSTKGMLSTTSVTMPISTPPM